jgi:hypothetical protein
VSKLSLTFPEVSAAHVRIRKTNADWLQLAEVQVLGY